MDVSRSVSNELWCDLARAALRCRIYSQSCTTGGTLKVL